jgi:Na+-driven multidrug efflux pump
LTIFLSIKFGIPGIWYGMALSDVVQGGIMSGWFLRGKWKEKKI